MLQGGISQNGKLITQGFLVAVEVEEGVSLDHLINKIGEGLRFVEGVGNVEVEHLGELDVIEGVDVVINTEGEEVLDLTPIKES